MWKKWYNEINEKSKNYNLWGNEMIRNIKKEDAKSIREICDVSLGYIVSTKLVEK